MAPGNAWHFPSTPEALANYDSMRSPVFPVDPRTPKVIVNTVTVFIGNQWSGSDTAGDLLSADSFLHWRTTDSSWTSVALAFDKLVGNNKYFRADIPLTNITAGTQIQYYCTLIYNNREPTFLGVAGNDSTGRISATYLSEEATLPRPFTFTVATQNDQKVFTFSIDQRTERGEWSNVFSLPNVAAHASLLRTGKILMWGRRGDTKIESMNTRPAPGDPRKPATCRPWLLDLPITRNGITTADSKDAEVPFMPDGLAVNAILPKINGKPNANLFCSGHAFLPNGDLIVSGGHIEDGNGLDQSCIYEITPKPSKAGTKGATAPTVPVKVDVNGTWTPVPATKEGFVMGRGRWYPTVTALPSGIPLVVSGTTQGGNNNDTQVLDNNTFTSVDRTGQIKDLYPRIHIASTQIAYSISLAFIYFLDLKTPSPRSWQPIATRADAGNDPERSLHDYGCSVMYDKDKVVYIGGGKPGTAETDTLDLGLSDPTKIKWQATDPMMFRRRQHNATILPDGTVLVTGGTRGDGRPVGGDVAFNDLRSGRPVHVAELWNPSNVPGKQWTRMASEQIDRCYHSTAILLPDGRVLSAGGGEFQLNNPNSGQNPEKVPNPDADSHLDAQVFSPPYLFLEGARPVINSISTEAIVCNTKFEIGTELPEQITKINLIGLSSVTHSMNTGQRLVPLKDFVRKTKSLIVSAPPDTKSCPPGYYLLFIINQKGQPSIGKIVQIVPSSDDMANALLINTQLIAKNISPPTPQMMRKTVRATANGTRVEIGITPTCPYGLSACWGGAYEALSNLPGVEHVDPIAHMSGSTASVFLEDNRLPDLELWTRIFKAFVRDTYILRGFEAVITGIPEIQDKTLVLRGEGMRSEISLARLGSKAKVQWDPRTRLPQIPTDEEMAAYDGLFQSAVLGIVEPVSISGPLSQSDDLKYTLQVRLVQ